jgi:hypothetical protein
MNVPVRGADFCPRMASGRSKSSRRGFAQDDLAWRRRERVSMALRKGSIILAPLIAAFIAVSKPAQIG